MISNEKITALTDEQARLDAGRGIPRRGQSGSGSGLLGLQTPATPQGLGRP